MKKSKKITKQMLASYYTGETLEASKNLSPKNALRWLSQVNRFLNKLIGVKQRLKNEKIMRKLGW